MKKELAPFTQTVILNGLVKVLFCCCDKVLTHILNMHFFVQHLGTVAGFCVWLLIFSVPSA